MRTSRMLLLPYLGLIIALLILQINATIVVQVNNGTQSMITTVEIVYIGTSKDLIGEPISAEMTTDRSQVTNRIYVIKDPLAIDEIVVEVQKSGARAVVYITPVYFVAGYLKYRVNDRQAVRDITIPVFEVPVVDGQKLWTLAHDNQIINATVMPGDGANPWEEVFSSPAFYLFPISLAIFSAANLALATWKFIVFVRYYGGFRTSVSLFVLTIEIISNLIRLVAVVDAFGSWGLYTEQGYAALIELSWPFSISSYLLFTLYWHEMMTNATVVVNPFMTKMRIPFFVLSGFLICLQVTRIIVRNTSPFDNFTTITAIIYLVVLTALLVFYGVTGTKLLLRLNKSRHLGRAVNLRKSTIRILVCGGLILCFVIVITLFVGKVPYETPAGFVVVWFILYMLLDAVSTMAILAFELPSKHSSGGSGSSKTSSIPERKYSIASGIRPDA